MGKSGKTDPTGALHQCRKQQHDSHAEGRANIDMIASGLRAHSRDLFLFISRNTRRQILYPLVGKLGAAVPGWIGSHQFFFFCCVLLLLLCMCVRLDDTCGFPHYERKRGGPEDFFFLFIRPSHNFPLFCYTLSTRMELSCLLSFRRGADAARSPESITPG